MPDIRERLQQAKQRINPEGLAVSGTLAGASILAIPTVQAALTYSINEFSKEIPTDAIKYTALGILACTNLASIAIESRTLKKQQYSASPIASSINVATGKPVVSSALGHTVNFIQSYGLNPVNLISVGSLLAGDQGRLFAENAIGVGVALGLWNIGFNSLISNNRIEPIVGKMRDIRQTISERLHRD
jgi:hypothetical protein